MMPCTMEQDVFYRVYCLERKLQMLTVEVYFLL